MGKRSATTKYTVSESAEQLILSQAASQTELREPFDFPSGIFGSFPMLMASTPGYFLLLPERNSSPINFNRDWRGLTCVQHRLKQGFARYVYLRVNIASNTSLCVEELNVGKEFIVNDQITACYQTNVSPKNYFKRCKQLKWTLKNCLANKFSKPAIAIL